MSIKLDELDAGILELLQQNGRMMYKNMARQLGVSLPTIRARIRRLHELGVIEKFTVVVNPDKIFGKTRAVFVIEAKATDLENIGKKLAEMREVREVYVTAGAFGVVAKVEVNNIAELEELVTKKFTQIPEIVNSKNSIVVKTLKEEYGISAHPGAVVQFRCAFCGAIIVEEPYIEEINGVRLYFTAKSCAEAYKQSLKKL